MTELQKREFDLLRHFIGVCETLGLTWYLVCGSALGAVKYQGFIPWDDDVDVAMPRRDYDIFVEKARALLPPGLFVQTYGTDPAFPKVFCKLRDSGTTFVEAPYRKLPIHHGVFIDIFALDGYPRSGERASFERRLRRYLRQTSCALELPRNGKSALLCRGLRLLGCHRRTAVVLARLEEMLRSCSGEETPYWCNYGNFRGRPVPMPKEVYGSGAEMTFEGLSVRVPARYDAYLRQMYGDYRKDLPAEEQVGHHCCAVLDLHTPCIQDADEVL